MFCLLHCCAIIAQARTAPPPSPRHHLRQQTSRVFDQRIVMCHYAAHLCHAISFRAAASARKQRHIAISAGIMAKLAAWRKLWQP